MRVRQDFEVHMTHKAHPGAKLTTLDPSLHAPVAGQSIYEPKRRSRPKSTGGAKTCTKGVSSDAHLLAVYPRKLCFLSSGQDSACSHQHSKSSGARMDLQPNASQARPKNLEGRDIAFGKRSIRSMVDRGVFGLSPKFQPFSNSGMTAGRYCS